MTLDQLRIFIAVAELQHVTRAAERLNLTQSAVSRAITILEDRYQVGLFNRVGRRIELTAAGVEFLSSARMVCGEVNRAEATLVDLAGLKRGSLAICASKTISSFWLPPKLLGYLDKYPNVHMKVDIGNTAECTEAVVNGSVELGFIEGEVEFSQLEMNIVASDRLVLVVGAGHPWVGSQSVSRDMLPKTFWALREEGSGTRSSFKRVIEGLGLSMSELKIALQLPSNEALCTAVSSSRLATVVSSTAAQARLASGELFEVPFDFGTRAFRLISHRERRLSRAALALMTHIGVTLD